MTQILRQTFVPLANAGRNVTALMISGVARKFGIQDLRERIEKRPVLEQAVIVFATLGLLFLSCLLAAQFGIIGMLLLFLAIIVIAR